MTNVELGGRAQRLVEAQQTSINPRINDGASTIS